jgi:membrane fusion protein
MPLSTRTTPLPAPDSEGRENRDREPGDGGTLFRSEVIQARRGEWLGRIRLARPLSFTLMTAAAVAMTAALVAFAVWGQYTRSVTVPGALVPEGGTMDIVSLEPGTVVEVLAREGDEVRAGQPLVRLTAERQVGAGSLGLLQIAALRQRAATLEIERRLGEQQAALRVAALSDRLRSLQADHASLVGELESARHRVRLAAATVEMFADLAGKGFASKLQSQQRQEELIDQQLRERNAARSLEANEREQQSVQSESTLTKTQQDIARSQLDRQLATIVQEESALTGRFGWALTAPRAGRVSALTAVAGQSITAGTALATLLPAEADASALVAHLYAPSRTAGFVEPGQQVGLRYAAYPYQKFGMHAGRVTTVSRTPVNPQDLPPGRAQALMAAGGGQEPLYRVTVALASQTISTYGTPQPLKSGMAVEAQLQQGQRAIWEWVLEPVLAVWKSRP